jgi:hypothetical protein
MRLWLTLWLVMVLGPGTFAAGQNTGWTRLEDQAHAPSAAQAVTERNGGRLRIEGARLLRSYRKQETEIGCTLPAGPGALRALVTDPFGLTFVAAENGLFVTSPESELIDRLRLRDGAPLGAPNSLLFDAERRLWIAGDDEFGVLEPSHFFGRSIAAPAPGPYRLAGWEGELIVVLCGEQAWGYRPDSGAAPEMPRVQQAGKSIRAGELLEMTFEESLGLVVNAEASAGVVLRYALDGSHVWSLLEDLGPGIEPGQHTLEIVAMDRDLRISEAFKLRLRVLYPFYYRTWFVISLAGLLTLLVFACFKRGGSQAPRALLSTGLLLVIALQILAGVIPHGRGWPFIGYSMYTESRDAGHISFNGSIVGFGKRGVPIAVPLGTLGMAADNRWQILRPIITDSVPGAGDVPRELMRLYNAKHPEWEQVERLQVWAKRRLIEATGTLEIAPLILSDFRGESKP